MGRENAHNPYPPTVPSVPDRLWLRVDAWRNSHGVLEKREDTVLQEEGRAGREEHKGAQGMVTQRSSLSPWPMLYSRLPNTPTPQP